MKLNLTREKVIEILKLLSIPLILAAIYASMFVLWKIFHLPDNDQLILIMRGWLDRYGLWIVFISAVIEGFLLLGQYFPGGFIIFLGVISAGKDIPKAAEVVSVVSLAFLIAYSLNYLVGKYGWYALLAKFGLMKSIEKSKEKLIRQGLNVIFFSYWEPNLASLTATAAGILKVPFAKFSLYSAIGIVIWNAFWGTLVYALGESALKLGGIKYIFLTFGIWVAAILIKKYVFDRKTKSVLFDIDKP